ncbi:hypothetical protein [Litorimonas sp.]|uniref:hypothetical protein n=1 Tax=Litorimonas sp. TaxID=1892381 RepID=UPI003A8A0556
MSNYPSELNDETLWQLPKNISDKLRESYKKSITRFFGGWLYVISLLLGFAIGGLWLWPYLEGLNTQAAVAAAKEEGGLLYSTNFGIGLLIALFVWILGAIIPVLFLIHVLPMPLKGALFFAVLAEDKNAEKNYRTAQSIMNDFSRPDSAEDFVNAWTRKSIVKIGKYFLPALILTTVITLWETRVYSVFTPTEFHRSTFFTGDKMRTWDNVQSVELGCNTTDDSNDLIYDVSFKGGGGVRIAGKPLEYTSWIDSIKIIDNAITQSGAEFKRWSWLKRDPVHSNCLFHYNRVLNQQDYATFEKILRLERPLN